MNATEILKQDHREVDMMIAELESATENNGASLVATFEKLKHSLTVHAEAEEQILYPAMEEFNETEDLADEAYEEHGEVKQLLEDMTGLNPSDEKFQSLLAELKAGIQHHVAEEEGEMFPKAEELLGEEALQTMGDEIEAFKGEATGGTSNIATA